MRLSLLIAEAEANREPIARPSPDAVEALDDALIAGLTPVEIAQMTDDELVRAIRTARLPLHSGVDEHLEFHDRRTLERLAYLARRCCQNRTSSPLARQPILCGGE